MPLPLVVAFLGSIVAFAVASAAGASALAVAVKPLPVLILALHQRRGVAGAGAPLVAAGLVLSAVGDVLLELPQDLFVPGLGSFLLAHLLYILAFTRRAPRLAPLRALPLLAFGLLAFSVFRAGLGPLALPVGVYVAVICTMGWRAAAMWRAAPPAAARLALAGALVFMLSDTLIGLNRFVAPVPWASPLIMATYWAGQVGIALSTTVPAPRREEAGPSPQAS